MAARAELYRVPARGRPPQGRGLLLPPGLGGRGQRRGGRLWAVAKRDPRAGRGGLPPAPAATRPEFPQELGLLPPRLPPPPPPPPRPQDRGGGRPAAPS